MCFCVFLLLEHRTDKGRLCLLKEPTVWVGALRGPQYHLVKANDKRKAPRRDQFYTDDRFHPRGKEELALPETLPLDLCQL